MRIFPGVHPILTSRPNAQRPAFGAQPASQPDASPTVKKIGDALEQRGLEVRQYHQDKAKKHLTAYVEAGYQDGEQFRTKQTQVKDRAHEALKQAGANVQPKHPILLDGWTLKVVVVPANAPGQDLNRFED